KENRKYLFMNSTNRMLEYLDTNNIIKLDKKDITMLCENYNASGLLFALSKENTSLTKNQQKALFAGVSKTRSKTRNEGRRNGRRRRRLIKQNDINNTKFPEEYDKDMPQVIDKLLERNVEICVPAKCWDKLLNNNCINTIQKLASLGRRITIDKHI